MPTDRARGALVGVTVGDCLGATVEFQSPQRIQATYGVHREIVGGGVFDWRPGQGTDDTDMTLALARAYADGFTLSAVAGRFLDWYHADPPDIGAMTGIALAELDRGTDPERAGVVALDQVGTTRGAGNGSLMRAMPTALATADPQARAVQARQVSALTHADPRCVDACAAYVELAAALLAGATVAEALAAARSGALCEPVRETLAVDPATPVEYLSTSGYVLSSLAAAVWAVQQDAGFEELLVALVNRGDDADTTGAIAGGLLGARDGLAAIPARWAHACEATAELTALADRLTAAAG